jgi:hypothetical protein
MIKLTCPVLALLILSGCATVTPSPEAGKSVVELKAQAGNELTARRLDTYPASSLSHFQVAGGTHVLEVGLVRPGYRDSQQRCVGTLSYGAFMPNQRYTLIENTVGESVRLALVDYQGATVARTDQVACL